VNLMNSSKKQKSFVFKKKKQGQPLSFSFLFWKKKKKETDTEMTVGYDYDGLDKKLLYSLSPKKIPSINQIKQAKKVLNTKEKVILNILLFVIVVSGIVWLVGFYKRNVKIYPQKGGEYIEGLIGAPKNINPLYDSARDVDSDISRLIFSSLFKRDGSGNVINDLVEEYSVSDNGLEYSFKIKNNVKWHNGEKLTSADIVFTIETIKNSEYGSPLRSSLTGASIQSEDEYSFKIILKESYSSFLDVLTFGILPQNLWSEVAPSNAFLHELNIKPIGSGPYKFKSLTKTKSGDIKEFVLIANDDYYEQEPYIEKVILKFYTNYNELISALNNNQINGISYLPYSLRSDVVSKSSLNFNRLNLPQISSIFFNQKKNSILSNKSLRQSLAKLIDKNKICDEIFSGNASLADGPILPNSPSYNSDIEKISYNYDEASKFLDEASWSLLDFKNEEITAIRELQDLENQKKELSADAGNDLNEINTKITEKSNNLQSIPNFDVKKNILERFNSDASDLIGAWRFKKSSDTSKKYEYLSLELTTVDLTDNILVAEFIKASWEKVGIRTTIKTITPAQIQSDIVAKKDFEALLLSQVLGGDQDNYAFWHSSQISNNGLNISEYKNKDVDKLLEEARLSLSQEDRIAKYKKFQELLYKDYPNIFLYYPSYTYVQSKKIKGFDFNSILNPADRFNNISHWYIKTNKKLKLR